MNSWPTIVELISIYKRLRAFEATLEGEPLPEIDQRYLEREQAGVRPEDQPALERLGRVARRLSRPPLAVACCRRPRPLQIVAIADADDIGLDADLAGKALQRAPVGAVIHQREMEAELQRHALALHIARRRPPERLVGALLRRPPPRPAARSRRNGARRDCSPWRSPRRAFGPSGICGSEKRVDAVAGRRLDRAVRDAAGVIGEAGRRAAPRRAPCWSTDRARESRSSRRRRNRASPAARRRCR